LLQTALLLQTYNGRFQKRKVSSIPRVSLLWVFKIMLLFFFKKKNVLNFFINISILNNKILPTFYLSRKPKKVKKKKPSRWWLSDKSLGPRGLLSLWSQVRAMWLLIWWSLEAYMVVNFRTRRISRGVHKLARTPISNKKKKFIDAKVWKHIFTQTKYWTLMYSLTSARFCCAQFLLWE